MGFCLGLDRVLKAEQVSLQSAEARVEGDVVIPHDHTLLLENECENERRLTGSLVCIPRWTDLGTER